MSFKTESLEEAHENSDVDDEYEESDEEPMINQNVLKKDKNAVKVQKKMLKIEF